MCISEERRVMKLDLSIMEEDQITCLCLNDSIVCQDIKETIEHVVGLCRQKDIRKVILDGREPNRFSSMVEMYEFGSTLPVLAPEFNWALVSAKGDEDLEFITDVARNRGASIQLFDGMDRARAWLISLGEQLDSA